MEFNENQTDNNSKKMLVITITWMGENQVFNLLKNLKNFSDKYKIQIKVFIIGFYDNKKAHIITYKIINIFKSFARIKLDADMDILDIDLFNNVLKASKKYGVTIYPVFDFIIKHKINGVHFFHKNTEVNYNKLNSNFPDQYDVDNINISNDVYFSHCNNPSKEQIRDFFAHRIRKAFRSNLFLMIQYMKVILKGIKNHPFIFIIHIPYFFFIFFKKEYKKTDNILECKNYLKKFLVQNDFKYSEYKKFENY